VSRELDDARRALRAIWATPDPAQQADELARLLAIIRREADKVQT
jgi:uncharacterized protein with von Willebrand factor type A (vWA) domain